MDRRDRAGMAGVDVAEIEERGAVAQLLQQYPVRPHTQGRFQKILCRDFRGALLVLRVEHVDHVAMRNDQFARVFDRQQPLMRRNKLDQPFRERRLSRAGRDRKSVVWGKISYDRVYPRGRRYIKIKQKNKL